LRIGQNVPRAACRISRDRHAGSKRLEQNEAECVGEAREHEDVGRGISLRELFAMLRTGEQRMGIRPSKLCGLRAPSDQDFAYGKVEVEKGLDVFLNGDAADIEKDGPRSVEADRPRSEQVDVDATRPRHQALKPARF